MDRREVAQKLSAEKETVKNMAYALKRIVPQSGMDIENDAHRICAWIEHACELLDDPLSK